MRQMTSSSCSSRSRYAGSAVSPASPVATRRAARPSTGLAQQEFADAEPVGHRQFRHVRFAQRERQVAAPGDLHGVFQWPQAESANRSRPFPRDCAGTAARCNCAVRAGSLSTGPSGCRRAPRGPRNRPACRKRTSLVATTGAAGLGCQAHRIGQVVVLLRPAGADQFDVEIPAEQVAHLSQRCRAPRPGRPAHQCGAEHAIAPARQRDQTAGAALSNQRACRTGKPSSWPSR